jgi:hypothetical protein
MKSARIPYALSMFIAPPLLLIMLSQFGNTFKKPLILGAKASMEVCC